MGLIITYIAIAIVSVLIIIAFYRLVRPSISLWIHAIVSGARVDLIDIAKLHIQKVKQEDINKMVGIIIVASKAGVLIDLEKLDDLRRAGGNTDRVAKSMIIAKQAGIPLTLNLATSIDLAGRNVLEAVKMRVNPQILDTKEVIAQANDGIELKVFCRVTLQSNINNFVGGADKETVIARVREGIVDAIGSAARYEDIIENPYSIADFIMGVDRDGDNIPDVHQNTAFEVLSIDVSNVNLGENIAARLQSEKALADALRAKADAERRRADAVRHEEEMKARVTEMQAELIAAEAEVPLALAEAIAKGNL